MGVFKLHQNELLRSFLAHAKIHVEYRKKQKL